MLDQIGRASFCSTPSNYDGLMTVYPDLKFIGDRACPTFNTPTTQSEPEVVGGMKE